MESISALKLSMLACGHSNMPLIALISGKFRVSSPDFRAPTTPQRRTGARALGKATAMSAAADGINRYSKAINDSSWALTYSMGCINKS